MSGWRDSAVAKVAARQKSLVTTAQLAECGLDKDAVAYRVHSSRFTPVFHGVYSVGCGELPPLALELAAMLACGPRAFISHQSAAFVWGLRKIPPRAVEVSVVGRCCGSRKGMRVHRIQAIDRSELRRENGLWVSSPARVALETAAVGSGAELVGVVDAGLAARLFTARDLELVLARNRPCRGAARLADLLGDETAVAISRSRPEKILLRLIRDAGLPRPDTNVMFGRFEADFVWRRERLVVELDSETYHSGPGAVYRDREKDLVFRDHGFEVLRFTRAHVVLESTKVLVRIATTLAGRTSE